MSFDAQGYRQAALQAGLPQNLIQKTIAERTGARGWLTEGRQGVGGLATAAGNFLNLPSYAIGGALNKLSNNGQSPLNPDAIFNPVGAFAQSVGNNGLKNTVQNIAQVPGKIISGNIQGVQNKQAVMENLPKSVGVDPNSAAGLAIGLGGELLTPQIPIEKLASVGKLGNIFAKAGEADNIFSKAARAAKGFVPGIGEDLIKKSYKLSGSDIDNIAQAIGVTSEAEKPAKVIAYLEGLGLSGANTSSLKKLEGIIGDTQGTYNGMVRTDKAIGRKLYSDALLEQALSLEKKADTPQTRALVQRLTDEAERQAKLEAQGVGMTDTFLRDTTTKAFNESSADAINNPFTSSVSEQMGRAGVKTLDQVAPGSAVYGKKLRGLREAESVLGKKTRTGLGTQLLNSFKPGVTGFGLGVAAGYSSDQNPLKTGLLGAVTGSIANNPRFLNAAGKSLTLGGKGAEISSAISKSSPYIASGAQTGFRIMNQNTRKQSEQQTPAQQLQSQEQSRPKLVSPIPTPVTSTYTPPKKNVFRNSISKRMGIAY